MSHFNFDWRSIRKVDQMELTKRYSHKRVYANQASMVSLIDMNDSGMSYDEIADYMDKFGSSKYW
jgi:hypothetical protein